jgi:signal peptidase
MAEELNLTADGEQKAGSRWQKALHFIGTIFYALLLIMLLLLTFATLQSRLSGKPPQLAGYQMYIVLGGSISPTFEMGSLALLKPVEVTDIQVGDIITYSSPSDAASLTTHRVMEIHEDNGLFHFITRGDANEVNDPSPVAGANVLGKVIFTIPYLGYLLHFGRSKVGLLMLVVLPGLIIMSIELRNLYRYYLEWKRNKESTASGEVTAGKSDSLSQ